MVKLEDFTTNGLVGIYLEALSAQPCNLSPRWLFWLFDGAQRGMSMAGVPLLSAQWLKTRCTWAQGSHKHGGLQFLCG